MLLHLRPSPRERGWGKGQERTFIFPALTLPKKMIRTKVEQRIKVKEK